MKVVLSPRQRFELAVLFCGKTLKLADLAEMKAFNRARLALRLTPITELITRNGSILTKTINDTTLSSFDLETAGANLICEKILPEILQNAFQVMLLGEFVELISAGTSDTSDAKPLTEAEEWAAPETAPQPTFEDLRTFFGMKNEAPRADVLAQAEALCAPVLIADGAITELRHQLAGL